MASRKLHEAGMQAMFEVTEEEIAEAERVREIYRPLVRRLRKKTPQAKHEILKWSLWRAKRERKRNRLN